MGRMASQVASLTIVHSTVYSGADQRKQKNFVFFDLRLNKRLSEQWWGWWLETPPGPLWRHFLCFQWADIDMKCTCDSPLTKSDLTFARLSLQFQRGRLSPKPQLMGSFRQTCLRTVASSNQQFFQFSLIVLVMPHQTPLGIRHEVLVLAREGMR